ncbi:MAG: hypothetical protein M1814_004334 [Vezdaea aestivalis]|nr:MAG: hypothetical protein M1814_004334 [Vezdaea aestivalis]
MLLKSSISLCPILFALALASPWKRDGGNSMCLWKHPRVAIIRDTLYVDGGFLYNKNTTSDYPQTAVIPSGQVYTINFTRAFSLAADSASIFQVRSSTNGPANNIFPNYYDGFMFANNEEYILYGGLVKRTDAFVAPNADTFLTFEQYQSPPIRQLWAPGFVQGQLPSGVTRYITAGAGVNVPSENLGFYFSGLHSTNWGNISSPTGTSASNATIVANTLISVDMSVMRSEKWTNDTLPSIAEGRISGETVWIPTSKQGVLVVLGGVSDSESVWRNGLNSSQSSNSTSKSPGYMKTVLIYDVAAKKWYSQETSGDVPPQLTEACTVVASAKDSSSHNVYLYGGYDGLTDTWKPTDDVWVLSIPAFIWLKVATGTATHARFGHRCAKPYPDQMIVIGGNAPASDATACLEGGAIQIFNLNTLKWQTSYDPVKWSEYKVPAVVTAKIGGSADGGATTTAPGTWSNSDLPGLFTAKYSKTIPSSYPYPSVAAATSSPTAAATGGSSGLPKWAAILIGVLVGLIGICTILGVALLWLRHKHMKRGSSEAASTTENGMLSWLRGIPPQGPTKAGTVTETESDDLTSPGGLKSPDGFDPLSPFKPEPQEAASTPRYELAGESLPTELPHTPSTAAAGGIGDQEPLPAVVAGIPRPESPTAGSPVLDRSPAMASIDQRSIPHHSHSHSRSISSDLSPHSPIREEDRGPSPISPPDSARTSIGSMMLGHKASSASHAERRGKGQSSFSEILE